MQSLAAAVPSVEQRAFLRGCQLVLRELAAATSAAAGADALAAAGVAPLLAAAAASALESLELESLGSLVTGAGAGAAGGAVAAVAARSPAEESQEICQQAAARLFAAGCSADYRAAAAMCDQALRLDPRNGQAQRLLTMASEFDLDARVANFFITHQHQSDLAQLQADAAALAAEQVAIGRRAAAMAEEASQLGVAVAYFEAALRLSPGDEPAALVLEETSLRVFEAKDALPAPAPPHRPADAAAGRVEVVAAKVTRGVERADRGGRLYVAYELVVHHALLPPEFASADPAEAVEAEVEAGERWLVSGPGAEHGVPVRAAASAGSAAVGTLWHGEHAGSSFTSTETLFRLGRLNLHILDQPNTLLA